MILLAGMLVGALTFRIRGDEIFEQVVGRGKTTADAAWAAIMALFGLLAGLEIWQAAALGLGLFAGGRLPWWKSLTLGRKLEDGPVWRQFALHGLRGFLWTLPAALAVWLLGATWVPLAVAGLLCVPAYELGWRINSERKWIRPTEIGEWLFGAAIGAAVVVTGLVYANPA